VDISIDGIMMVLILANLLLLGFSQLRSCVRAIALQGVILGALPLLAGEEGMAVQAALLSIITIALKGIVFPRLLLGALRESDVQREAKPYVGYTASMLVGFVALAASAWLASRLPVFGASISTLAAPVAFFMIFTGLFLIVSRKTALSQILGYLVLENGMYVFGVVMLREMPLLVELGVLLDAFAAVFVMGVAVYHINREFDHMDVDQLDTLKG
jgi:hydrogenase-4 component E